MLLLFGFAAQTEEWHTLVIEKKRPLINSTNESSYILQNGAVHVFIGEKL